MSLRPIIVSSGPVAYLKNGVIRYHDRDIVMVVLPNKRQPFYKSSGRNSGMPNTWLPFDGVRSPATVYEWFDKTNYCLADEDPLDRFGNEYLKDISNALGQLSIPEGEVVESGMDVNFFLGVLNKYADDRQRQTWARNQGRGVCCLPSVR